MTICNCTVSGNATGNGGNGGNGGGSMNEYVDNSRYGGDGGSGGNGAGICICNAKNTMAISFSTISANATGIGAVGGSGGVGIVGVGPSGANGSDGQGAGIFTPEYMIGAQLFDTIVALDIGSEIVGWYTSLGHNLIGGDPKLGPLADNGGPTKTHALLPGSPAIDAGANTGAPATDQRGFPRIVGAAIDIGSYECGALLYVVSEQGNCSPSPGFYSFSNGQVQAFMVTNSPVTLTGQTQYSVLGWIGAGSIGSNPNGGKNAGSYTITNYSSITWLWQTNYWLDVTASPGVANMPSQWFNPGATATVNVNSPVTLGGTTQCVALGWVGTGSVGSNPTGGTTADPYTIMQASSIAWLWQTNYYVTITTNGNGTVSGGGWLATGSDTTLVATPSTGWYFAGWAGNTSGCVVVDNVLTATIAQPLAVSATFFQQGAYYAYMANNGTITITAYTGTVTDVLIPGAIFGLPVTGIASNAFAGCTNVTSISIPASMTNIGMGAFAFCSNLTNITVDVANAYYSSTNGVLFNKSQTLLIQYPAGMAGSNYTIPNSVTGMGDHAFASCTNLTGIWFQGNAPGLGSSVFTNDANATVYYVSGFTGWGSTFGGRPVVVVPYTFANDGSAIAITTFTGTGGVVTIPSMLFGLPVTSIDSLAFQNNSTVTSITIPNGVTSIGVSAFYYCSSLTNITIPGSVTSIGSSAFYCCGSLKNIVIPSGVASIGDWTFYYCSSLTNVVIPASVTSIGNHAFDSCSGLKSLVLPPGVTNIATYAFSHCNNLKNLTLPNGITSIGDDAFYFCGSLPSLMIPSSVTSLGNHVFDSCGGLLAVYFKGNAPGMGSLDFSGDSTTVYYFPGTTGWGSTFGGRPAMLWNPQVAGAANFGVSSNRFGFVICGTTNLTIVVDVSTNLVNPVWTPVATNTLATGSSYFCDAHFTNRPSGFYRFRAP
jgi:hypothetical protein